MWILIGVIIAIVLIFIGLEIWRELHMFQVSHFLVASNKLKSWQKEKRIVLLADLHNKVYGNQNDILLQAIKEEHPDLILIAGDMLVGKPGCSPQVAVDFVTKLPDICPVYYGNGNHEQRMKEKPEKYGDVYAVYKKELVKSGVHLLENTTESVNLDGVQLEIRSIELPMHYYEKFQKHVLSLSEVTKCIGLPDASKYQIVISHNPAFLEVIKKWGADLIVSGHLHGGIIRIPGLGGLITPQAKLFPENSGGITIASDARYVVSRGLGTHTVNIRLFNKAEVVTIHLRESWEGHEMGRRDN
ncbi:MAG: metallophosphoesterase [Hespellia sp.]|nr:metallophosphoesterase [Hespellia sp.]